MCLNEENMGTRYTAGFVVHHGNNGLVCTLTHHRCGFGGCRCGVGKPDLRVTHMKA